MGRSWPVSRRLTSTCMVLCAAADYLARHGTPSLPADLRKHRVLSYSLLPMQEQWQIEGPEGPVNVAVWPVSSTSNGDTCRHAALQGMDMMLQPSFLVANDIRSGLLYEILPGFRSHELGICAVCPTRQLGSHKVRVMIDFLRDAFRSPDWTV